MMFSFQPTALTGRFTAMRNVTIDSVDAIDRPVLAIGTDYPPGHLLPTHSHRRAQFLYGATGVMEVGCDDGAWVVPPQRGVWIPAGKPHRVRMLGVSTRSLYIEPCAVPRQGGQCEVLNVSPLLRQLLMEAVELPPAYDRQGRDGVLMRLMLHELARAEALPLHVPLPRDAALAGLCVEFLRQPDVHVAQAAWAARLNVSERTFNRRFSLETGMPFGKWRQRACVLVALSRLAAGEPVTAVALDMGYDSPGAFSTMFRKTLGRPPSHFSMA
jgi:AraC-like DNA-binding protein/mannose-6-phosphate isomerase-like protein (cupin superfamily)